MVTRSSRRWRDRDISGPIRSNGHIPWPVQSSHQGRKRTTLHRRLTQHIAPFVVGNVETPPGIETNSRILGNGKSQTADDTSRGFDPSHRALPNICHIDRSIRSNHHIGGSNHHCAECEPSIALSPIAPARNAGDLPWWHLNWRSRIGIEGHDRVPCIEKSKGTGSASTERSWRNGYPTPRIDQIEPLTGRKEPLRLDKACLCDGPIDLPTGLQGVDGHNYARRNHLLRAGSGKDRLGSTSPVDKAKQGLQRVSNP